ncbi:hypothetical protein ACYIU7_002190, partial [Clostridium botulinum]
MLYLKKHFDFICRVFNISMDLIDKKNTLIIKDKIIKNKIIFKELNSLFLELKDKNFSINITTNSQIEDCYIKFKNLKQEDIEEFIEDIKSISQDELDIEIKFDKNEHKKNKIYIYGKLKSFISDIEENWMYNEIFEFTSTNYKKSTVLIIEEEDLFIENDFFIICNCDTYTSKNIEGNILRKEFNFINVSKSTCNWINIQHKYSPQILYLESGNNKEINNAFKRINSILILMYISNYVELKENKITCIINSIKRIYIEIPNLYDFKVENEEYKWLFKCFELIYDSNNIDKFSILRNVIGSLIVCRNQGEKYRIILENSKWIYDSTNDNWEMFLSSNIDKYFEKKYKLKESIKSTTQKLQNKAFNIVKDIYKNSISIILLIVGSIVGKSANVIKWSSIVGIIYLMIYGIAYITLIIIENKDIKEDFNESITIYKKEFNPNESELKHNIHKFNK